MCGVHERNNEKFENQTLSHFHFAIMSSTAKSRGNPSGALSLCGTDTHAENINGKMLRASRILQGQCKNS